MLKSQDTPGNSGFLLHQNQSQWPPLPSFYAWTLWHHSSCVWPVTWVSVEHLHSRFSDTVQSVIQLHVYLKDFQSLLSVIRKRVTNLFILWVEQSYLYLGQHFLMITYIATEDFTRICGTSSENMFTVLESVSHYQNYSHCCLYTSKIHLFY